MYIEPNQIIFGIPVAMWAFLVVGAAGGYFAGRYVGYAKAIHNLYIPARDRQWAASDRMRSRMEEREAEQRIKLESEPDLRTAASAAVAARTPSSAPA